MSTPPPPSYEHPGAPPRRPELPEGVWRPEPPARARDRGGAPGGLDAGHRGAARRAAVDAAGHHARRLPRRGHRVRRHRRRGGRDGRRGVDDLPGALIGATFAQDALLDRRASLLALRMAGEAARTTLGLRRTPFLPALGWAAAVFGAFWLANVIILVALRRAGGAGAGRGPAPGGERRSCWRATACWSASPRRSPRSCSSAASCSPCSAPGSACSGVWS